VWQGAAAGEVAQARAVAASLGLRHAGRRQARARDCSLEVRVLRTRIQAQTHVEVSTNMRVYGCPEHPCTHTLALQQATGGCTPGTHAPLHKRTHRYWRTHTHSQHRRRPRDTSLQAAQACRPPSWCQVQAPLCALHTQKAQATLPMPSFHAPLIVRCFPLLATTELCKHAPRSTGACTNACKATKHTS